MPPRPRIVMLAVAALLVAAPPGVRAQDEKHDAHAPAAAPALPRTPRPADAVLYLISPAAGATVESPVTVRFGLKGMGVAPAGVDVPKTGHHHLIVDAPTPPLDLPLPADTQHIHFGGGQTETTLELPAGTHTLQLVLADKAHIPHDPPLVSETITITVK